MKISYHELAEFAEQAVDYIHSSGFKCVVSCGESAWAPTFMAKRIWKLKFPETPLPKFIGLRFVKGMPNEPPPPDPFYRFFASNFPTHHVMHMDPDALGNWIKKRGILKFNANEILLFDEVHSGGRTFHSVRKALSAAGVKGEVRAFALFSEGVVPITNVHVLRKNTGPISIQGLDGFYRGQNIRGMASERKGSPLYQHHEREYKSTISSILSAVNSLGVLQNESFHARKARVRQEKEKLSALAARKKRLTQHLSKSKRFKLARLKPSFWIARYKRRKVK